MLIIIKYHSIFILEAICIIVYINIGIAWASHNIQPAIERKHFGYRDRYHDSHEKYALYFENYLHLMIII